VIVAGLTRARLWTIATLIGVYPIGVIIAAQRSSAQITSTVTAFLTTRNVAQEGQATFRWYASGGSFM
jgi:hypothetical protein